MRVLEEMRVLDDRLIGDTQAGEKRKQDWQMGEKQESVGAAQSGLSRVWRKQGWQMGEKQEC